MCKPVQPATEGRDLHTGVHVESTKFLISKKLLNKECHDNTVNTCLNVFNPSTVDDENSRVCQQLQCEGVPAVDLARSKTSSQYLVSAMLQPEHFYFVSSQRGRIGNER